MPSVSSLLNCWIVALRVKNTHELKSGKSYTMLTLLSRSVARREYGGASESLLVPAQKRKFEVQENSDFDWCISCRYCDEACEIRTIL